MRCRSGTLLVPRFNVRGIFDYQSKSIINGREALPTQQKIERVSALAEKLERSTIAVATDFTGISVNEMNDLRKQMRANGVEFTIIKNTLMDLAADAANRPQFKEIVQGPTAIAFGYEDPLNVAKAISDFVRTTRSPLAVRGAVMGDGPVMS